MRPLSAGPFAKEAPLGHAGHAARKAAERERAARARAGLPRVVAPPPPPTATAAPPPSAPPPPPPVPQATTPPAGARGWVPAAAGAALLGAAALAASRRGQKGAETPSADERVQDRAPEALPAGAPEEQTREEVEAAPAPPHEPVQPPPPAPAPEAAAAPPPAQEAVPPAAPPAQPPSQPPSQAQAAESSPDTETETEAEAEVEAEVPPELTPPLPGAPGLLLEAVRGGESWAVIYRAMLTQAAMDVQAFAEESTRLSGAFSAQEAALRAAVQKQVLAAERAAGEVQRRAAELAQAVGAGREAHALALQAQRAQAHSQAQAALRQQADAAASAAAVAILSERAEAQAAARVVQDEVDALHEAFTQRSAVRARHREAHRLAAAALAWERRLREGAPFGPEVDAVLAAAQQQPHLLLAAASVRSAAHRGVQTRDQLQRSLAPVASQLRRLQALPAGEPATLPTYVLARLAAALRVTLAPGQPGGGVEGAIAQAQQAAASGQLRRAAEEIEAAARGSAAAAVVAAWVESARERAAAEQALELVRAHCALLAAAFLEPDVRE